MNDDLPLDRHAVSICWLAFIIGTALLLIIPGIFQNYNLSQVSEEPVSVSPNVRFHAIIQEASDLYQVEPELIRAIIMAESSNNPRAVSGKGARGLMQLMPATAKALGWKTASTLSITYMVVSGTLDNSSINSMETPKWPSRHTTPGAGRSGSTKGYLHSRPHIIISIKCFPITIAIRLR